MLLLGFGFGGVFQGGGVCGVRVVGVDVGVDVARRAGRGEEGGRERREEGEDIYCIFLFVFFFVGGELL